MKFIKPYTKKLLKDLDNESLWENDFFAIKHKQEKFQIISFDFWPMVKIWNHPEIKFNLIEKYLIAKKSSKIKMILLSNRLEQRVLEYFK